MHSSPYLPSLGALPRLIRLVGCAATLALNAESRGATSDTANADAAAAERVTALFRDLSQIFRDSHREDGVRRYLTSLAEEANARAGKRVARYETDAAGNLMIRLAGTGRHAALATPVALQAHMDMVLAGDGSLTDPELKALFAKGVALAETEGWLHAKDHRTTLGADNGIGVALAARYLTEGAGEHPPLELLFTAAEERGLEGAKNLAARITAPVLLNLDGMRAGHLSYGCLGSRRVSVQANLTSSTAPADATAVRFAIEGLRGGHSGETIHEPRMNAILAGTAILGAIAKEHPGALLISARGGEPLRLNVIPNRFEFTVAVPPAAVAAITQLAQAKFAELLAPASAENSREARLTVVPPPSGGERLSSIQALNPAGLASALAVLKNGPLSAHPDSPNGVGGSCNLGWLAVGAESPNAKEFLVRAAFMARSYTAAELDRIVEDNCAALRTLAPTMQVLPGSASTPWLASRDSWLYQLARRTLPEAKYMLESGGIEPAAFVEKYPGLLMISLGPTIADPHSARERLKLDTVAPTVRDLRLLLAAIGDSPAYQTPSPAPKNNP